VVLCEANGDEYGDTLDNKILGALYILLGILRAHVAGLCLMRVASCDSEVVEILTVDH